MKRIDIKISFGCNNFCDFCAQGTKRARAGSKSLAGIKAALTRARKQGVDAVVFTGGEPTLHPGLPAAVRLARGLGYESVQVQTNGRRFANYDYCLELKQAGVTEVSPSLHGSTPVVHEGLTKAPGGFAEVARGILNCRKAGFYVLTNTVITSKNYKDLPALARLLVRLGVDQFQFAFVHLVGTAWENRSWLTPRKTDALTYIKKALDIGRAAGRPCYTEAVPFCLMKGYEDCVAERVIPEGPVSDDDLYIESYGDYRRAEGKAKRAGCRRCAWYKICEGPWREYPGLYGWSEFKPVVSPSRAGKAGRKSGLRGNK
ncbi:MAG: putative Fe-S oxidoreductase [Elusimicrobia bacterium]|nr:MAG: putative Fe-S oxidoreductase [Elusimicrobiota bacterium]KAF0157965.1 MAG: putative Fe-S oxidoreductase [Elusimicrobiota bacterium]